MWQDYPLAICVVAFGYALVPQILHGFRTRTCGITAQTSAITSAGLAVCSVCGYTLGLLFTGSAHALCGVLWAVLLWQRLHYGSGEECDG